MALPGPELAEKLQKEIEAALELRVTCRFDAALKAIGRIDFDGHAPWMLAESAASSLRQALGCGTSQLPNSELAEVLHTSRANFKTLARTPVARLGRLAPGRRW